MHCLHTSSGFARIGESTGWALQDNSVLATLPGGARWHHPANQLAAFIAHCDLAQRAFLLAVMLQGFHELRKGLLPVFEGHLKVCSSIHPAFTISCGQAS